MTGRHFASPLLSDLVEAAEVTEGGAGFFSTQRDGARLVRGFIGETSGALARLRAGLGEGGGPGGPFLYDCGNAALTLASRRDPRLWR